MNICCHRRQAEPSPVVKDTTSSVRSCEPRGEFKDAFREAVFTPKFRESIEASKALHIPNVLPRLPEAMGDLDALMKPFVHGGEHGSTCAYKRGEPFVKDNLYMAYLEQASLVLTDAEQYFPCLMELCQGLMPDFEYVTARLVVDPPAGRGGPLQLDGDVLAVQLGGVQDIVLRKSTRGLPVTACRPPQVKFTVKPGDVVYVPSGVEWSVEVSTQIPEDGTAPALPSGPCMAVLLSLRGSDQSLRASLGKYMTDVLTEKGLSEGADNFFRSAVTKRTLPDRYPEGAGGRCLSAEEAAKDRAELEAQLRTNSAELSERVSAKGLRKHFAERMVQLRQEQRQGAAKIAEVIKVPLPPQMLRTHSLVRVTRGVNCTCDDGASVSYFKRNKETLSLPISPSASKLINDLSDGKPHKISTLRCDDALERLCVCQILVQKDCLEPVDPRSLEEENADVD